MIAVIIGRRRVVCNTCREAFALVWRNMPVELLVNEVLSDADMFVRYVLTGRL